MKRSFSSITHPASTGAGSSAREQGPARNKKKRPPREATLTHVEDSLAKLFGKYGLAKAAVKYTFTRHWPEVVGEKLARLSTPEVIRGNTLFVRVPAAAWAQELSFHKELILKRLKPFLSDGVELEDIQFRVSGSRYFD